MFHDDTPLRPLRRRLPCLPSLPWWELMALCICFSLLIRA